MRQTVPVLSGLLSLPMVVMSLISLAQGPAAAASGAQGAPQGDAIRQGGPREQRVYVGTYTSSGTDQAPSKGIYTMRLNLATGSLSDMQLVAETPDPSFLALHPNGRLLYAVNETDSFGKKEGGVTAFAIGEKGGLTRLNDQPSGGAHPCYIIVDRDGTHALVANYSGGNIAVLPIGSDGQLKPASSVVQHRGSSVNQKRQQGPHAHSIDLDPTGRFAISADLGLDRLLVYRFDPRAGTLTANEPAGTAITPGSGPRHVAFHPNGRIAYAINELTSTVTVLTWDGSRGALQEQQTLSTLPAGYSGTSYTAEIHVHPSGRFVYGSNRGHDSIAIFGVDAATGRLGAPAHQSTGGRTPRYFGIDPTGTYLLAGNQASDSVVVFRIDQNTGTLTEVSRATNVPSPVSFVFMPAR